MGGREGEGEREIAQRNRQMESKMAVLFMKMTRSDECVKNGLPNTYDQIQAVFHSVSGGAGTPHPPWAPALENSAWRGTFAHFLVGARVWAMGQFASPCTERDRGAVKAPPHGNCHGGWGVSPSAVQQIGPFN